MDFVLEEEKSAILQQRKLKILHIELKEKIELYQTEITKDMWIGAWKKTKSYEEKYMNMTEEEVSFADSESSESEDDEE